MQKCVSIASLNAITLHKQKHTEICDKWENCEE